MTNITLKVIQKSIDFQSLEQSIFYKTATIKGYITIQRNGEVNAYHSQSVDIEETVHSP